VAVSLTGGYGCLEILGHWNTLSLPVQRLWACCFYGFLFPDLLNDSRLVAHLNLTDQMHNVDTIHEVEFDVTPSLKERMARWDEEGLGDDLLSLSPLTSPDSSPTATPTLKTVELPEEISSLSEAIETAQERLKRRRCTQGRNNQAKRLHKAKLEERNGPPVRADAEKKYAANSVPHFTSASATESNVASTGYVGLNRCTEPKKEYSLRELKEMGFDVLKWDGW